MRIFLVNFAKASRELILTIPVWRTLFNFILLVNNASFIFEFDLLLKMFRFKCDCLIVNVCKTHFFKFSAA